MVRVDFDLSSGMVVLQGENTVGLTFSKLAYKYSFVIRAFGDFVYVGDEALANALVERLLSGDRWVETVILLSLTMSVYARARFIEHQLRRHLIEGAGRSSVERSLFKRVYLSILRAVDAKLRAHEDVDIPELIDRKVRSVAKLVEERRELFEDKEAVDDFLEKLSNVKVYLLAHEISKASHEASG